MKVMFVYKNNQDKDSLESKIIEFFKANPSPGDDQVHALAEELKIEPSKFETNIYSLISAFLTGGLSGGKEKDFPEDKIAAGVEVEMEHVDKDNPFSKFIAEKIARDHLTEDLNYYDKLKTIENDVSDEDLDNEAPTLAWDFDGVLSSFDEWKGQDVFGAAIKETIDLMKEYKSKGYKIIIFTTRKKTEKIEEWLKSNGAEYDEFIGEKPFYSAFIDDRAINFKEGKSREDLKNEIDAMLNKKNSFKIIVNENLNSLFSGKEPFGIAIEDSKQVKDGHQVKVDITI